MKGVRARGLCWTCAGTPEIRNQYPPSKFASSPEPSQEELDRMIAEQMTCLPAWWEKESEKMIQGGLDE